MAEDLAAITRELYVRNVELAVRNKTLSLLRKLDEKAISTVALPDMAKSLVSIVAHEFGFPLVALGVIEERKLRCYAMASAERRVDVFLSRHEEYPTISLSQTSNACIKALQKKRRTVVKNLSDVFPSEASKKLLSSINESLQVKQSIVFPLFKREEPMGVLVIGLARDVNDLSRYERETISALLGLIVVSLEKAQIYASLQETTEKLRTANKKLQQLDGLKTEFLSIASHQLRTPLAIMKGYVSMMQDGMLGRLNRKQMESLGTMRASTEQLIVLVNQLLDLTRIESGRLLVRPQRCPLHPTVSWAINFIRPQATAKGLEIFYVAPEQPVNVWMDPEKMREVFINLLDNAVKYTESGSITVTVERLSREIAIHVKDTGYGMTTADQHHLFEKFATGSSSKNVKTTSGLGLYVCRKLVQAMDGRIMGESRGKGKGSQFTVFLRSTPKD